MFPVPLTPNILNDIKFGLTNTSQYTRELIQIPSYDQYILLPNSSVYLLCMRLQYITDYVTWRKEECRPPLMVISLSPSLYIQYSLTEKILHLKQCQHAYLEASPSKTPHLTGSVYCTPEAKTRRLCPVIKMKSYSFGLVNETRLNLCNKHIPWTSQIWTRKNLVLNGNKH